MNTEYKWTYLLRDSQRDEDGNIDGHSFWRDENSGRISIKDMSGSRPDTTDDGPLWLSTAVPWKIGDKWTNAQVEVERTGEVSVVGIVSDDAPRIAAQLGFRIIVDKKSALGKMLPLIRNLSIE